MDLELPTKFGQRLRSSGSGSHHGNAADHGVIRRFPSGATRIVAAAVRRRIMRRPVTEERSIYRLSSCGRPGIREMPDCSVGIS